MTAERRIRELLDRINSLQDQTDLDLLLFLFRHPNALLTVEFLAAAVGHDPDRVEQSLEGLIAAGLVRRANRKALAAHSFVFRPAEQDSVFALLQMASTRPGRLALLDALQQRATTTPHKRKA